MKRNWLRPLTRPVRSPLHSSPVVSQRIEDDTFTTISLCSTT